MHAAETAADRRRAGPLRSLGWLLGLLTLVALGGMTVHALNGGLKAANVPLVPGMEPPAELAALRPFAEGGPLVVGLTNDPTALVAVPLTWPGRSSPRHSCGSSGWQ